MQKQLATITPQLPTDWPKSGLYLACSDRKWRSVNLRFQGERKQTGKWGAWFDCDQKMKLLPSHLQKTFCLFFTFFFNNFVYLLYFWMYWVFVDARVFFPLVAASGGHSAACELLTAVASLVEHEAPGSMGFSSGSSQALEHRLRSCGAQA